MIEEGVTIFAASPSTDEALEEAKRYIKKHGLTSEDVRIVPTKDKRTLSVITKRHIELRLPGQEEIIE
jgi:hypothetical protein